MKLFSQNEIHTGRQIEVDIAKFICLIGLVIVHSFEILVSYSETSSAMQYIIVYVLDFIFGAGTFMFCMGIGIAYSSHNSPAQLMKRGIRIFLLGYLLNVFCSLFYLFPLGDPMGFVYNVFGLDIMQFAGLALLLFGFLQYIKLPDWGIAAVAVGLSVGGSFIYAWDTGSHALNLSLGLFIGTFDYELMTGGIFPLFNWFIFVVAGYFFAKLLRRCEDKGKLYLYFSGVSAAILAAYMVIAIPNRLGMMGSVLHFHHMKTYEAVVCIAGALFALGIYYALSHVLSPKVQALIERVSRNINTIYCLQWVTIAWTFPWLIITGHNDLPDAVILLMGVAVFLFCAVAARCYSSRKQKRGAKKA